LVNFDKKSIFRPNWNIKTDIIGTITMENDKYNIKLETLDGNQKYYSKGIDINKLEYLFGNYECIEPKDEGLFEIRVLEF
jgi:hypothetical protein